MIQKNITQQGFSRLKGFFRSGINYSTYEQIVPICKRPVLGNVPKDVLELAIKANPKAKKEAVITIQKAYDEAANILPDIENLETQAINRIRPSVSKALGLFLNNIGIRELAKDKIFKEKSVETILRAEESMLKKIKSVLPEVNNVILSPIGSGSYKNIYKLEILNKNNELVCDARVLQIFKKLNSQIQDYEKTYKIFSKFTNQELQNEAKKYGIDIYDIFLDGYRMGLKASVDAFHNPELMQKNRAMFAKEHGAYAEANISEYIRYMSGHRVSESEGLVLPDMFVLSDNPYAVSKYIGSSHEAKRDFNFCRLGLEHNDLLFNPDNKINGICIDIGGIKPKKPAEEIYSISDSQFVEPIKSNITGNKDAVRLLKKIHNIVCENQEEFFFNLKKQFESDPDKKKKFQNILKEIEENELFSKKDSSKI